MILRLLFRLRLLWTGVVCIAGKFSQYDCNGSLGTFAPNAQFDFLTWL